MQKYVIFVKKKFEDKNAKDKKYWKVRNRCHYRSKYRGAAHSICNLKYSIPKEIAIIFQNECNYDYHFTIKELAEEFEGQFTCLRENTKKCITFSVPIEKEITRISQHGEEIIRTISYRMKII